jgi:hypothetical protein
VQRYQATLCNAIKRRCATLSSDAVQRYQATLCKRYRKLVEKKQNEKALIL